MYFLTASEWFSNIEETRTSQPSEKRRRPNRRSHALSVSWYLVHIIVVFPIAAVICLGPFFSPYIGVKIAQRNAWNHRCDPYPVEVILEGRSYSSPANVMPRASFYFWQNGLRTKYYEYTLDQEDNVWHFRFSQIEPGITVPTQVFPSVQDISYQLANQTLSGSCATDLPPNALTPCMEGSFEEEGYLSFTINNTLIHTVTDLRAVDKFWVPSNPVDDAPGFILKEVEADNSLGQIMLRTAVTKPGQCGFLKLCAETDVNLLAAVGLTLLRQNEYATVCTTPNSS